MDVAFEFVCLWTRITNVFKFHYNVVDKIYKNVLFSDVRLYIDLRQFSPFESFVVRSSLARLVSMAPHLLAVQELSNDVHLYFYKPLMCVVVFLQKLERYKSRLNVNLNSVESDGQKQPKHE